MLGQRATDTTDVLIGFSREEPSVSVAVIPKP